MLFCCLSRNIETSCHKHFAVLSRHQQTPPLTTSDKCHNLRHGGPTASYWQHMPVAALTARLRIAISAYPHLHSTPPLGGGGPVGVLPCRLARKTRMTGLPDGETILMTRLFVSTEFTNVTDTHTDRHTDIAWRHRPRIASRGKNNTA